MIHILMTSKGLTHFNVEVFSELSPMRTKDCLCLLCGMQEYSVNSRILFTNPNISSFNELKHIITVHAVWL